MRQLHLVLTTAVSVGALVWGMTYLARPAPLEAVEAAPSAPQDPAEWRAALQRNRAETRWVEGSQRELKEEILAMRAELEALREKPAGSATIGTEGEVPPSPGRSEDALAAWMDNDLLEHNHAEKTRVVTEELHKLTQADPNLDITNTSCSERFCRASVTANNGELPPITSLLGDPKLASAGFMVAAGNGVMEVYFTPPGSSLESLREEAFAQLGVVR